MNIDELTPAPWEADEITVNDWHVILRETDGHYGICQMTGLSVGPEDKANAEFIALARNAFDVMMRRGWWADKLGGYWYVAWTANDDPVMEGCSHLQEDSYPDPFTALVEAEKWYVESFCETKT